MTQFTKNVRKREFHQSKNRGWDDHNFHLKWALYFMIQACSKCQTLCFRHFLSCSFVAHMCFDVSARCKSCTTLNLNLVIICRESWGGGPRVITHLSACQQFCWRQGLMNFRHSDCEHHKQMSNWFSVTVIGQDRISI